jgi:excisionase family DNA binding protein
MAETGRERRFLTVTDVAEILATSTAQVYALLRRGDLRGIQIGGRGQWRVETIELEAFIQRMYAQADQLTDEPTDRPTDQLTSTDGSDPHPAE